MNICTLVGIGNLIKNGEFTNRKTHGDHEDPIGWQAHSLLHPGLVAGETYAAKVAFLDTDHSSSYYACTLIRGGVYTAYAQFKPLDTDSNAKLLMHCYDSIHNTGSQNQAFEQDFILQPNVYTECLFTFTAPDYTKYLHFSPRSLDDKYVLVINCKLGKGELTLEQMRKLPTVLPIFSAFQHSYPV